MEIYSFETIDSTQRYLVEEIKSGRYKAPCAVIAQEQSSGVGSRDNSWSGGEGNFFASVAIDIDTLPEDLSLASSSIYFSFIMQKVLRAQGIDVWLKWPNDFYQEGHKVGGTITQKMNQILICGIGINLKKSQNGYEALHSDIEALHLLHLYLNAVSKFPTWKQIFIEYEVEFELSRAFSVHIDSNKKSLQDACLCKDGSLIIDGKKVFSLR